jgi:hypothetical protein
VIDSGKVELVGVEDDYEGGVRLYYTHRSMGVYALVTDPEWVAKARQAWAGMGRVFIPRPERGRRFQDRDAEQFPGPEWRP